MNSEELITKLSADPVGRLRWRVCREFGVLPSSRAARALSDRQVVFCGAQMVLDRRGRAGRAGEECASNGSFDPARFRALAEGRT